MTEGHRGRMHGRVYNVVGLHDERNLHRWGWGPAAKMDRRREPAAPFQVANSCCWMYADLYLDENKTNEINIII